MPSGELLHVGARSAKRDADSIIELLRADGGRITRSRRVIVDVLLHLDDHHLTAADIVDGVRRIDPSLHETTVYRTLERLEEIGVIAPLATSGRASTYQLTGHDHAHLVCTACGTEMEVSADLMSGVAAVALAEHDFELSAHPAPLYGTCGACRRSAAPTGAGD